MQILISSGNGVDEVCRAIWHFKEWLEQNFEFDILQIEYASCKDGYKSLLLETKDSTMLSLEGTHLWRCQSPFRPKHRRKNWYFSVSTISKYDIQSLDETKVIYQTMKSPKKGGQHVNTTCSGVRAIYQELQIEAISYDERSQHRNRQIALYRLKQKAKAIEEEQIDKAKIKQWQKSKKLVRGEAIKVFVGRDFTI